MFAILSLFLACGEKSTDTSEDTASESTSIDPNSIEGYVDSYCSVYAVRCGVYSAQEDCYNDMITWFDTTCSVSDETQLDTCLSWLNDLSCDESGWIDECSNFYTCE